MEGSGGQRVPKRAVHKASGARLEAGRERGVRCLLRPPLPALLPKAWRPHAEWRGERSVCPCGPDENQPGPPQVGFSMSLEGLRKGAGPGELVSCLEVFARSDGFPGSEILWLSSRQGTQFFRCHRTTWAVDETEGAAWTRPSLRPEESGPPRPPPVPIGKPTSNLGTERQLLGAGGRRQSIGGVWTEKWPVHPAPPHSQ